MIKRGRHVIRNYMTLNYEFSGIRLREGYLSPVDWHIGVNLIAEEKEGKKQSVIEHNAGISFQRLYFWLDTNMPGIIVASVNNEDDLYIANLSSNIMMYCPENSGDDIIIRMLHSKLSVLSYPNLVVGEIKLKSSDSSITYTFDCQDGNYDLPLTTADYYSEGAARDVEPWWSRNDGFCFEFIKPTDNELSDEELFKDIVDPMDEFDRVIASSIDSSNIMREPAKILQVEKWKPKTV